jgi:DNA invertase Pin-like site-specific DNA recombinase
MRFIMNKSVAIYARVSTKEQNEGLQINELRDFCKVKNLGNVIEFVDRGESGTKISRPRFDKMMKLVRNGEIHTIVVWKFDRASRSTKQLITLLDELKNIKVNFISLREQIDTTTPIGKAMFGFIGILAELERDFISERVKAGMAEATRNGKHIGRPKQVNNEEILRLKYEGLKTSQIATQLKISNVYVRKILKKLTNKKLKSA